MKRQLTCRRAAPVGETQTAIRLWRCPSGRHPGAAVTSFPLFASLTSRPQIPRGRLRRASVKFLHLQRNVSAVTVQVQCRDGDIAETVQQMDRDGISKWSEVEKKAVGWSGTAADCGRNERSCPRYS